VDLQKLAVAQGFGQERRWMHPEPGSSWKLSTAIQFSNPEEERAR